MRGERDATQAETISGFAEKPLGFYDTSHVVRFGTNLGDCADVFAMLLADI